MNPYDKLQQQLSEFMLSHEDTISKIERTLRSHVLDRDMLLEATDGEYTYLFVIYRGLGQNFGANVFFINSAIIDANDALSFTIEKTMIVCKDIYRLGFFEINLYLFGITGHTPLYDSFISGWEYRERQRLGGSYERLVWR